MKTLTVLILAIGLVTPAISQSPAAKDLPVRIQTEFSLHVSAPYAAAAPLFGPEGERAWAGDDWDPHFISPQPAQDLQGAVFTIKRGNHTITWVNTLFDIDGHHIHYVYFIPDVMVTEIDIRFTTPSAKQTDVHVTYTRTALTVEGGEHVKAMSEHDNMAGKEWQQAIEKYLGCSRPATQP